VIQSCEDVESDVVIKSDGEQKRVRESTGERWRAMESDEE
jgi:hypothetical protein